MLPRLFFIYTPIHKPTAGSAANGPEFMMKHYDFVIVGASLYGATFAYLAKTHGKKSLILDRRPVIGGNLYCENRAGINVHKYGAHIFHTSNPRVWEFVTNLVPFNRYTNSPLADYKGKLYNLPFNMNTFNRLWGVKTPDEARQQLETERLKALSNIPATGPRNLEEQALALVGKEIYEMLIKGYTEKQWGRPCNELPPFIIKRLPVRWVFDNNYFNDTYQGIPENGYNRLIERLTEGCDILTDTDYLKDKQLWNSICDKVIFTGQIDEYFEYIYGKLSYRTVRFETEVLDTPNYQGNAVINYTDTDTPYTRIIEHKHFECFGDKVYDNPKTVISREYSTEWQPGMEPFYPVNDDCNTELYNKYRLLAENEHNIIFGGRLAEYKYYDMDKVIEACMKTFQHII